MKKLVFRGGPAAGKSRQPAQVLEEAAQEPYSLQQAQALAGAMSAWERRLRGYDLFPYPVALEPPFAPLFPALLGDEEAPEPEPHDDGPLSFVRLLVPPEQKVAPDAVAALLRSLGVLSHPVALEVIGNAQAVTFQIACARSEPRPCGIFWRWRSRSPCPEPEAAMGATRSMWLWRLFPLRPLTAWPIWDWRARATARFRFLPLVRPIRCLASSGRWEC